MKTHLSYQNVKSDKELFIDNFLLLIGIFSLFALVFSLFLEYWWQIQPCKLCYLQRLPYFFIVGISILGFVNSCKKLSYFSILGFLVINIIPSSYHLLVQTHVITDFCIVSGQIDSIENFEALILNSTPSCAKISWSFLNLSLSFYNLIFSLMLFCRGLFVFHKT